MAWPIHNTVENSSDNLSSYSIITAQMSIGAEATSMLMLQQDVVEFVIDIVFRGDNLIRIKVAECKNTRINNLTLKTFRGTARL